MVLIFCACVGMQAQRTRLVDSGWESMRADSVRPWTGFGVRLDGCWQDSVYTAEIEYPELIRIDADDLVRWNLRPDDIPEWPRIESSVGMSRGNATFDAGFLPIISRDGGYWAIQSYKYLIKSRPSSARAAVYKAPARERYTGKSVLSEGKWVKIRIAESGVYKLTYSSLRSMGFSDPSKVRLFGYGGAVLPETNLQGLTDDLPEQPLWRADKYMLFYGQGPVSWKLTEDGYRHEVNTYSDWGYYFLTDKADSISVSFTEIEADSVSDVNIGTYPDFMAYDPDEFSWYRSGRRFFEQYDYAGDNTRSYKFDLDGLASDSVGVGIAFSGS